MAGRPKKIEDDELVEIAAKLMAELGPDEFSLWRVGERVGMSASSVLRRFGSQESFLAQVWAYGLAVREAVLERMATYGAEEPLEAVVAFYGELAAMHGTALQTRHHLAFLRLDVRDAGGSAQIDVLERQQEALVRGWLEEATRRGVLVGGTPSGELASLCGAVYLGELLRWAMFGEGGGAEDDGGDGSGRARVERALRALLAPYRAGEV